MNGGEPARFMNTKGRPMPLTFGSLFAGIGGFDLGFERAGLVCKWQVEIDEYCRRVLAKHWPDVPRWDDVRTFPPPDGDWSVDVICGGFPCQDISNSGKRVGIFGERSSLWFEFARVVRAIRPRYVVVENVAALLNRGLDAVLGSLAEIGYDAEWDCLPAGAFGAPHLRERILLVAYPHGEHGGTRRSRRLVGLAEGLQVHRKPLLDFQGRVSGEDHWATEPDVVRMVDGVSPAVDRIRGLGNAVVPQVAEWIGRRIIDATERSA